MKSPGKRYLNTFFGAVLIGFLLLTLLISLFPNSIIDREFSEEIQEHQFPLLDWFMSIVSWPGYFPQSVIMVVLTACVFLGFNLRREALFILSTLTSGLISYSLKIIVNRPRPSEDFVRIVEKAKYQSFPSGHVLFYVIFFGFLIVVLNHLKSVPRYLKTTLISICAFLIITIPFSRVYLGAHWFTDVMGGFMLGLLSLYALSYIYLKTSSIKFSK